MCKTRKSAENGDFWNIAGKYLWKCAQLFPNNVTNYENFAAEVRKPFMQFSNFFFKGKRSIFFDQLQVEKDAFVITVI